MATFTHEELEPTLNDNKTVYNVNDPRYNKTRQVLLKSRETIRGWKGETSEKYTSTWVTVRDGKIILCKGILPPIKLEDIISLAEEQPDEPLKR